MIVLRLSGLSSAASLLAAAFIWMGSHSAIAQLTSCAAGTVCYYIAVQPIDVCPDGAPAGGGTGSGCAPFNTLNKNGAPATISSTNPIGFVDSTTGKDITRAIANQIGLDIAWQPMKQYNNSCYQTINIDSCTSTSCSSQQFAKLTGVGSSTYSCSTNPALPPLNPVSTVLNMFFVNGLNPPSTNPGTLYGYAWIGNNGIAISSNTFFPPFPLTPRYDTLVHEFFHNNGLNHSDSFNYDSTAPAQDLMTTGSSRTEPTSTSNALTQLGSGQGKGTADQLTCSGSSTSTQCTNSAIRNDPSPQQGEVALSGFLNPILTTTTTVKK